MEKRSCKNCFFYLAYNVATGKLYTYKENNPSGETCCVDPKDIKVIISRKHRACRFHEFKSLEVIPIMDKCLNLMASCIANYQYHSNSETEKPGEEEINNILNSFMEKAKSEL